MRWPGITALESGVSRDICAWALLWPHASHSTVEGPLPSMITPLDDRARCFIASGPGWPTRRCQISDVPWAFFPGQAVLGLLSYAILEILVGLPSLGLRTLGIWAWPGPFGGNCGWEDCGGAPFLWWCGFGMFLGFREHTQILRKIILDDVEAVSLG